MSKLPGTSHALQVNAGVRVRHEVALAVQTATAASGTGTFLDGVAIDRCDPDLALSAIPAFPATFTMASGNDCVVQRRIQHRTDSDDSWADYDDQPDDVTVTALDSGAAQSVDLGEGWNVDLSAAKPQVRFRLKPDFSASGTDTCKVGGVCLLDGLDTVPAQG